jgi:nucleotide-binding universal stress UspA family protein
MLYKRILLPTDGSPLSSAAVHAGFEFARELGAELIGVYVADEYSFLIYGEGGMVPANFMSEEDYRDKARAAAENYFKEVRDAATLAGVKFTSHTMFSVAPAASIVEAAEKNDCDLIFMGSHGRGALGQLLLGSVTAKVLSSCQIPVLVYRQKS